MIQNHVVTPLTEDHKLVVSTMKGSSKNKVLHLLEFTKEESSSPVEMAFAIRKVITNLPLRVGNEVTIITENTQALIEMLSVCFLQRRFNETVKITVKRESGEYVIPYIMNLKPGQEDEKEGMVDYSYGCGSCSGDCSSCG